MKHFDNFDKGFNVKTFDLGGYGEGNKKVLERIGILVHNKEVIDKISADVLDAFRGGKFLVPPALENDPQMKKKLQELADLLEKKDFEGAQNCLGEIAEMFYSVENIAKTLLPNQVMLDHVVQEDEYFSVYGIRDRLKGNFYTLNAFDWQDLEKRLVEQGVFKEESKKDLMQYGKKIGITGYTLNRKKLAKIAGLQFPEKDTVIGS